MEIPVDTVVMIPTKRQPPLRTLEVFPPVCRTIILADPDVHDAHCQYYGGREFIEVTLGRRGLTAQGMRLYSLAAQLGYEWFFRMDDDLTKGYFVDVDKNYLSLTEAVCLARECAIQTQTSLAGFSNTSRTDWLGERGVFRRSACLIHGGACIARSTPHPEQFINPELKRYDDVWRSAAHRRQDGAVGLVRWVGLDKRESLRDSSCDVSDEAIQSSVELLLKTFPDMVSCKGTRTLDGGRQTIPNLRMRGRPTPPRLPMAAR